jgi:hypothetical protein
MWALRMSSGRSAGWSRPWHRRSWASNGRLGGTSRSGHVRPGTSKSPSDGSKPRTPGARPSARRT